MFPVKRKLSLVVAALFTGSGLCSSVAFALDGPALQSGKLPVPGSKEETEVCAAVVAYNGYVIGEALPADEKAYQDDVAAAWLVLAVAANNTSLNAYTQSRLYPDLDFVDTLDDAVILANIENCFMRMESMNQG
jgi:hypothetical protein